VKSEKGDELISLRGCHKSVATNIEHFINKVARGGFSLMSEWIEIVDEERIDFLVS